VSWREWVDGMTPDEKRAYWKDSYQRMAARNRAKGLTAKGRQRKPRKYTADEKAAALARKREYNRLYRNNPEKKARIKARVTAYRNRPEVRAAIQLRSRRYLEENRAQIYAARKRNEDRNIAVRIKHNLRCRLRDAIKRTHGCGAYVASAVRDLGCSIEAFRGYMQLQFRPGMSWDNWGAWHIDHTKPLCDFDLGVREQVLKACHYTNLQPLWASENLTKNRWAYSPALSEGVQ
jgi:hypothetical protein